jgi:hypothetical protein
VLRSSSAVGLYLGVARPGLLDDHGATPRSGSSHGRRPGCCKPAEAKLNRICAVQPSGNNRFCCLRLCGNSSGEGRGTKGTVCSHHSNK